ncbi:hypothetical protein NDU88_010327 [Pleurodeles waltl]|uniref:Uncharacterized protein n=1 Tax=Pleurodeles waltl TaxID=8319 RepID=A0AAV7PUJ7_PLEWA|nr:hypothetical protein NDU88_010327 [Pleurodeles waltl]
MAQDAKVWEALALLQQAGRMDLVREEALAPGHPARRASAGVAAAGIQDPLDFEEEDPGEQDAARSPWEEAKAGPGAASRMSSVGWHGRRRVAVDASFGRCGGVGFAPRRRCLGGATSGPVRYTDEE